MSAIRSSILLNAIATINATNTAIVSFDGVAIGLNNPSTGAFTSLNVTGSAAITVSAQIGTGTASTYGILTMRGATTSGFGPYIQFDRNSTNLMYFGLEAGILANNNNNGLWYNGASNNAIIYANTASVGIFSSTGLSITGLCSSTLGLASSGAVATNKTSTVTLDQINTTTSRLLSWGPDNATAGTFTIGVVSANAGVGANPMATFTSSGLAIAGSLSTTTNLGVGTTSPDVFSRGYGRILGMTSASNTAIELNAATANGCYFDMGVNSVRLFNIYSDASGSSFGTVTNLPVTVVVNSANIATASSTGLAITGVMTATGNATIGVGGTGTVISQLVLSGGSASTGGSFITFARNGTGVCYIGTESALIGNTSNDLAIYGGSNNVKFWAGSGGNILTLNGTTLAMTGIITATSTISGGGVVRSTNGTIIMSILQDGSAAYVGTQSNHQFILLVNGSQVGVVSSTGLNSCPIGATTAQTAAFTTVTATSYNATSALKYKTNVKTLTDGFDLIKSLNPVRFDWKDKDIKNDVGFIADEINEFLPTLVSKNKDGEIEGLDYDKLTAVLASAIKEVIRRIEVLETK